MWDLIGAYDGGAPSACTVSTHHRDFGHVRIDDAQRVDNDSLIVGEAMSSHSFRAPWFAPL